ncbi:MAG TPA: RDD family protein [Phycisphaerae bacterium]|nr:RDD family protein [Phycisphaerae bacterium]
MTTWRKRQFVPAGGVGVALLAALALPAGAQPPSATAELTPWAARLVAGQQTLWLVRSDDRGARIFLRGPNEAFAPGTPLGAPLDQLVVSHDLLYGFTRDGAFYSLRPEGWTRELDLPGRAHPVELTADDFGLVALIRSPRAGELPRLVDGARPATSQPFDPGTAPFSVVRYDSQGWIAIAPAPLTLAPEGPVPPRLAVLRDALCLLLWSPDTHDIEHVTWDPATQVWRPGHPTPAIPDLDAFWLVTVSRVPTLIVATRTAGAPPALSAFRLFGGLQGLPVEWRRTPLQVSELPPGVEALRYSSACAFNQHAALLMLDAAHAPFVRWARLDGAPLEHTVAAADVFGAPSRSARAPQWIQGATLLLLLAVAVALFAFRRNAIASVANLPEDCAVALTIQRLVGSVVDLAPFLLIFAAVFGVNWYRGLGELFGWAAGRDAARGQFPALVTLLWWATSCVAAVLYCLIMELLTRRTVGKVLTGTRIVSETGEPATPQQILVRNALRLVELLPPLWVLGFLVVLSRNRQRLGDIFARTLVVRRVRPRDPAPPTD